MSAVRWKVFAVMVLIPSEDRAVHTTGGSETGAPAPAGSRSGPPRRCWLCPLHAKRERRAQRLRGASYLQRGSTFISRRRSTAAPVRATLLMVCWPRPSTVSCFTTRHRPPGCPRCPATRSGRTGCGHCARNWTGPPAPTGCRSYAQAHFTQRCRWLPAQGRFRGHGSRGCGSCCWAPATQSNPQAAHRGAREDAVGH